MSGERCDKGCVRLGIGCCRDMIFLFVGLVFGIVGFYFFCCMRLEKGYFGFGGLDGKGCWYCG